MKKVKKVLLIDDSKSINLRNKKLFEQLNLFEEIIDFTDPLKAINYLEKDFNHNNLDSLPEIIFLDIKMPEMDAFKFLNQYILIENIIKSNFKPAIVIVSDHLLIDDNFEHTKRYSSMGLIDQLPKPIDNEDLKELLSEYF